MWTKICKGFFFSELELTVLFKIYIYIGVNYWKGIIPTQIEVLMMSKVMHNDQAFSLEIGVTIHINR